MGMGRSGTHGAPADESSTRPSATSTSTNATSPPLPPDPTASLLVHAGVIEEDDLDMDMIKSNTGYKYGYRQSWQEDFEMDYGLIPPQDTVIIRPYGGEDDDILLQELRPRFVVMYEPNLAFIRRLEVS